MYHRFEENKYPSTNIKINDFKEHIKIIEENKIKFVNPKNFENELKIIKLKKNSFNIDDGFYHFMKMLGQFLKKKKYLLFYL